MSGSTYWELLKKPQWQKRRLEKLSANDFTCEGCYSNEESLHVHHKRYVKGRLPWEYKDFELAVLCDSCHSFAHEEILRVNEMFAHMHYDGPNSHHAAMALIAGYFDNFFPDELVSLNYDLTELPAFGLGRLCSIVEGCLSYEGFKNLGKYELPAEDITKIFRELIANYAKKEEVESLIKWYWMGVKNEQ